MIIIDGHASRACQDLHVPTDLICYCFTWQLSLGHTFFILWFTDFFLTKSKSEEGKK